MNTIQIVFQFARLDDCIFECLNDFCVIINSNIYRYLFTPWWVLGDCLIPCGHLLRSNFDKRNLSNLILKLKYMMIAHSYQLWTTNSALCTVCLNKSIKSSLYHNILTKRITRDLTNWNISNANWAESVLKNVKLNKSVSLNNDAMSDNLRHDLRCIETANFFGSNILFLFFFLLASKLYY